MKNIFKFLKDIWDGNFCKHPKEVIPQPQPLPEPPKRELQIGCLALGLVKSFKTEPDLWEKEDYVGFLWGFGSWLCYKHSLKNYLLQIYINHSGITNGCVISSITVYLNGNPSEFNKKESEYIHEKLLEYIVIPRNKKKEEEEKREFEKQNAYFVDLGCPKQ